MVCSFCGGSWKDRSLCLEHVYRSIVARAPLTAEDNGDFQEDSGFLNEVQAQPSEREPLFPRAARGERLPKFSGHRCGTCITVFGCRAHDLRPVTQQVSWHAFCAERDAGVE